MSDYEVLAKAASATCSEARQTVGWQRGEIPNQKDLLVFGELRPVDGGMPILLEKPSITVGQDRTCDVVIEHPSVSANHCLMEFREGHWFIEDLGSRGGIGVNGEKVESAWVPALSVINIGNIEFDLQYSTSQAASENQRAVSPEILSKLDRAMKSVQPHNKRRTQVRGDQPAPPELLKTPLGVLKPDHGGHSIPLLYDELYLGRDPDSDVVLPYLAVAKTHCVLRFQDGYWLVRDLNNNGISIDGQTVQEGWLNPGAVLGVATHRFELAYAASTGAAPPELAVPINEFDVTDEDSTVDGDVAMHTSESEEVEVDESALIDSDDEHVDNSTRFDVELDAYNSTLISRGAQPRATEPPRITPSPPPVVDEPLRAVDDMLASIEEMLPPIDDQPPPVAERKAVEPPVTKVKVVESPATEPKTVKSSRRAKKALPPSKTPTKISSAAQPAAGEPAQPKSSPARPLVITKQQVSVVQLKHERIVQFLKDREFDGLLLSRPASIAWYTGGADVPRCLSGQTVAALLITPEGGTLLARKADRDLLLNHTTSDVVLQHRECAWPKDGGDLFADWLGTKKIASDQPFEPCADVSSEVAALRLPLRPHEIENLRKLGIRVARTVERAAREFQRGDTEAQIAGDVASRLIRHEVLPLQIQVWGDGRGRACQNWKYGRETVNHDCTISVVVRRHGLHVAVSRSISFGIPSKELRWSFQDMLLAHVTALTRSQDQAELSSVWADVQRVCETLGEAEAWRAIDPGCVTGFELCEAPISATSARRLQAGMPVIWRSLIGPARAVDTILVREADSKVITQTGEWPQVGVAVNNEQFFVQTVLQRSR